MKLAKIKKIKAVAPNKKKISQSAFMVEDTLVIDEFEKGKWVKRGCIDKKGKSMFLDKNFDENFHETSIIESYCSCGYSEFDKLGNPKLYMDEESKKVCNEFFGINDDTDYWQRDIKDRIINLTSDFITHKRKVYKENRINKINNLMDEIPEIPDEAVDNIVKEYFPREYLIKQKDKEMYYCTACNCVHDGKKESWKNKADVICPGGKNVRVTKRKTEWSEKLYVLFCNRFKDNLLTRDACVAVEYSAYAEKKIRCIELVRTLENDKDVKSYYYQGNAEGRHYGHRWDDKNYWGINLGAEILSMYGLQETNLNITCARKYARKHIALRYWGKVLNGNHPQLEYLADCPKLAKEIIDEHYDNFVDKIVSKDAVTIWDALGLDKQRYLRLKQSNGGMIMLDWLKEERLLNKQIPKDTLEFFDKCKVNVSYVKFALTYGLSPAQIHHYILRENGVSYGGVYWFTQMWGDYLNMAEQLGHDPRNMIVLRCKNLKQRHDECVEELNRIKKKKESAEKERLNAGFKEVCLFTHDKYSFDDGKSEFILLMPENLEDIEKEGRALHHCINSSNRYIERMINKESYLGFVRRRNEPDKPYYTIEFEPDGSIRQKRSEYNNQPNLSEISAFLRIWQRAIKKRLTAEDYELAQRSKAEMQKNLTQLRSTGSKRDADFANMLEGDYEANEELAPDEEGVIWQEAI